MIRNWISVRIECHKSAIFQKNNSRGLLYLTRRGEIWITPYKPKAQCGDYQQLLMHPDRDATHWQINITRFNPNFLFLEPRFVQPCLPSPPWPRLDHASTTPRFASIPLFIPLFSASAFISVSHNFLVIFSWPPSLIKALYELTKSWRVSEAGTVLEITQKGNESDGNQLCYW